jgi:hypothetical protein
VPDQTSVRLVPSRFEGRGEPGDFAWMIEQPQYADALFVFNDNEEQFRAFQRDAHSAAGLSPGGGNAAIRPYRGADPPRAAGVPTGRAGQGYDTLTADAQQAIDDALELIAELLASGRYVRVIYSAANEDGDLGTGIFEVADDVKRYIVSGLRRLAPAG